MLKILQVLFKNVKDETRYRKVHFLTLISRFWQAISFPEFLSTPGRESFMYDHQGFCVFIFQLVVMAEINLVIFNNSVYGIEK